MLDKLLNWFELHRQLDETKAELEVSRNNYNRLAKKYCRIRAILNHIDEIDDGEAI
jgi:hypothetical protein